MQKLVPFLKQPTSPDYFIGIMQWTTASVYNYLQDKQAPRLAPSLVFLGFSISTLVVFLSWRLIRSCCRCFKGPELAYYSPLAIVVGREVWLPKLVTMVLVAVILSVCVLGVALSDNSVFNVMFRQVDANLDYFSSVVAATQPILRSISVIPSQCHSLVNASDGLPPSAVVSITNIANSIEDAANTGYSSLASTVQSINSTINSIRSTRTTTGNLAKDYYTLSIKGSWGLIGSVMLSALSVLLFMSIHCPAGVAISTLIALILSLLLFILDLVFGAGLLAGSDFCSNSEVILYNIVASRYRPIISYYSNSLSSSVAVESFLAATDLLNATDIGYQIESKVEYASSQMDSLISNLPSSYQDAFTTIQANLTGSVNNIINAIGSSSPSPSGLIATLTWDVVHPLYVATKTVTCCRVADQVTFLWAIFTTLAWLLLLICWAAMVLLARLDKLPSSGDCCSCTCLIPSQFELEDPDARKSYEKSLQSAVLIARAEAGMKMNAYGET